MKNIHVLPTEKNSWLCIKDGELINANDGGCMLGYDPPRWLTQHIYITSDEEIKEGDWFMSDFNSFPIHNIKELSEREGTLGWKQEDLKNNLKIILTTDQDLIKDGVQAIDDEFLEWFVKNPSCEEVKVIYGLFNTMGRQVDPMNLGQNHSQCVWKYKIIIPKEEPVNHSSSVLYNLDNEIPKEEPKQDLPIVNGSYGCIIHTKKQESKQETLEEAAENYTEFWLQNKGLLIKDAFIAGAKWQQERMYSEEEVEDIIMKLMSEVHNGDITYGDYVIDFKLSPRKWFEQHKKK